MSLHTRLSQVKWEFFTMLSWPFNVLPIKKRKIVFQNFSGRGYGDSPKYIAEAIINNNLDYDMVWLCNDMTEEMPATIRKVKYGSIKAYIEMATAGIWINNVWTGIYSMKRKGQFFLQTWHGSISMKKIEKAAASTLSHEYIRVAKRMSRKCDLMISNTRWLTEQYNNDFWYDGEILEKGLPRLDILYNTPNSVMMKVHMYFGIPEEKKIVLFAPTFRKNEDINNYVFNYSKCCKMLEEKFEKEYVMLVRLHPNAAIYQGQLPFDNGIFNATDYPDMQELLAASDILITDYSSSMFEMGMIGKKVFLLAKDYEDYTNKERSGMMFTLTELPFQMAFSEEELMLNIKNYDEEKNVRIVEDFFDALGVVKNNNSAVEILKRIEEKRS